MREPTPRISVARNCVCRGCWGWDLLLLLSRRDILVLGDPVTCWMGHLRWLGYLTWSGYLSLLVILGLLVAGCGGGLTTTVGARATATCSVSLVVLVDEVFCEDDDDFSRLTDHDAVGNHHVVCMMNRLAQWHRVDPDLLDLRDLCCSLST